MEFGQSVGRDGRARHTAHANPVRNHIARLWNFHHVRGEDEDRRADRDTDDCGGDGPHLDPRLVTQADGRQ
ncbi:MAG: hypothetical protein ACRET3_06310, partial [Burkholderiales bacterium]